MVLVLLGGPAVPLAPALAELAVALGLRPVLCPRAWSLARVALLVSLALLLVVLGLVLLGELLLALLAGLLLVGLALSLLLAGLLLVGLALLRPVVWLLAHLLAVLLGLLLLVALGRSMPVLVVGLLRVVGIHGKLGRRLARGFAAVRTESTAVVDPPSDARPQLSTVGRLVTARL